MPACEARIAEARYAAPTDRYPHGALGDDLEWGALRATIAPCAGAAAMRTAALPDDLVFEDTAPRLADLDGDGAPELIVVESDQRRGARLAIWGLAAGDLVRLAATPFIGTRFRWLAPVGAADLDGDGAVEIAYVDRPHLARVLRVWRYADGGLTPVASASGLTNHRLGMPEIEGGLRACGAGPEMVLATADWQRIVAVRLDGGALTARALGPYDGPASLSAALRC